MLKFRPRSKRCIHLGCIDSTKIWKLWDHSGNGGKGRIIRSIDIVFKEEENVIASKENSEDIMRSMQESTLSGVQDSILLNEKESESMTRDKGTIRSMICALYSMLYTLCSILYTLYSMLYALCSMLYALCSMLYALCSMLYALCSML